MGGDLGLEAFGNLAQIRGILYYKLSPNEQKPFATAFRYGIINFIPRTTATMYTWLPSRCKKPCKTKI